METNSKPSLINKLASFFKKKKGNADPVIPAEPQNQDISPSTEWFSIYGHGFHNGVFKVAQETDSFPDFLKYSSELEKTVEFQSLNKLEVDNYSASVIAAEKDLITLHTEKIDSEGKIDTLSYKVDLLKSANSATEARNRQLFEKREQTLPEYGWIPALLFLGAGVMFILGDISVTEDIAYNGFDMPKKEGQLFAIGLAFTVFLIKPLLDRMFEKPFQKANHELKKIYKALLFLITGLGLIMLLFLGHFRSDAKLAKLEKAQYSSILASDDESQANKNDARTNIGLISNRMGENWWGKWGIVLSTLIFAIGGAMCLSVAFPSLTQLSNRYWFIPFKSWINKLSLRQNNKKMSLLIADINNNKVIIKRAENRLSSLDLLSLKEFLSASKSARAELLTKYYQLRYSKESDLYSDGFNRGLIYSLDGDLKFKVIDPMTFDNNKSSNMNGHSSPDNETRKYNRRPFVKIRKMIADNYNKKQNNSTQDGTDFEILS